MDVLSSAFIAVFGLVFARVAGLIFAAPIFGAKQVPLQNKAGLAVMLALLFTPLQLAGAGAVPADLFTYGVLVGRELLIGLALGFAVGLIFTGVQMGSQLVGVQIGFGLGEVLNPASGAESTTIESFYGVLATVIFFTANGHHEVIAALARTFQTSPVGDLAAPSMNMAQLIALVQSVFEVALRIAMPAIAALLLADVALGLIGRAAPQMQIIVVGAPVKVAVGLLLLALSTPDAVGMMGAVFQNLGRSLGLLFGG